MSIQTTTNLQERPPRSPRVRLGGFAHLPRLIDKARAAKSDTLGVYEYGSSSLLDRQFFEFTGIDPEAFRQQVASASGDLDVLNWVQAHTARPLPPHEIAAWSHWIETVPGLSAEARAWFAEFSACLNPPRPDIGTLFEYLDVDDYVRFGGRA